MIKCNLLTTQDIDSINKDSHTALLNALYQCEDYILLNKNKDFIVNEQFLTTNPASTSLSLKIKIP